jgi:type II secretory pathway component GspD/PulD (secretin)
MKNLLLTGTALLMLGISVAAIAQVSPSEPVTDSTRESGTNTERPGIAIDKVIDVVAKKTGKKYVLDPRVHAQVQLVGEDLNRITYPELLTILHLYGFAAVESGGYILVVPQTNVRAMPLQQIAGKEVFPDSEYVSIVIPVTKLPAGSLVPILRPLLPTHAHLAAAPCSNSILIVDTYANVRRIEALIKALDTGDSFTPAKCESPSAKPPVAADSKPS